MNRFSRLLNACFLSAPGTAFWSGSVAACCLVSAVAPVRVLLGQNLPVDLGLLFCGAICLLLSRLTAVRQLLGVFSSGLALVLAALWCMMVPGVLKLSMSAASVVPLTALESSLAQNLLCTAILLVTLVPCFFLLATHYRVQVAGRNGRGFAWRIGFATCLLLSIFCILPGAGAFALAGLALVVAGTLTIRERWTSQMTLDEVLPFSASGCAEDRWNLPLLNVMTGAALAFVISYSGQLIQRGLISDGILLSGVMLGLAFSPVCRKNSVQSCSTWMLFATWLVLLVAGTSTWNSLTLQMNAHVSSLPTLILCRTAMLFAFAMPAGYFLRRGTSAIVSDRLWQPLFLFLGFAMGATVSVAPVQLAFALTILSLGSAAIHFGIHRAEVLSSRWRKWSLASLGVCCLCGILFVEHDNFRDSEKVLFSSSALHAARQGNSLKKVAWMDDGRLETAFDTMQGRLSIWKYRGTQYLLRQNGISTGMFSTDPDHSPESAADLLPALIPLSFHPAPQDVLVLSIDPSVLKACHSYPLRLVRTLDGNPGRHQLLSWLQSKIPGWTLEGGAAFQFGNVDPQLALAVNHGCQYDLILSPHDNPAIAGTVGRTSLEFYQAVARHLNPNGMFAQRIPYYDLGPDAVKAATRTMCSVFSDVVAVETVPGELVFLCSRESLPEINAELAERLKSPQCRRLLGEAGWDWSMVLGRGSLDRSRLEQLVGTTTPELHSHEARWTTKLALEVSRWGVKAESTRSELAKHGQSLAAVLDDESMVQELNHRLEDLNLAHQLQMSHPNDPWGYRSALKNRLQDRPRTALIHVNYEGLKRVLDPEDQRRKDYLKALGEAVHSSDSTTKAIEELVSYEKPYDPLVSLFVNYEAIQLIDRHPQPDLALQFRVLLKTVYFANSNDQSVRNVAKAIQLLCEEEDLGLSPSERWDHLNGMMQVLATRWQMRWNSGKTSKYDAVDTEQSAKVVDEAMKLLASSAGECGLTASDWEFRKMCLEENLVRPLRQSRSRHLRTVSVAPVVTPSPTTETSPEERKTTSP